MEKGLAAKNKPVVSWLDKMQGSWMVAQWPCSMQLRFIVGSAILTSSYGYADNSALPVLRDAPTNRNPYTVTYAYDHRGRMVSKRIYDSALKMLALPNHPTTQPPSGGCVCLVIGISDGGYAACIGFSRRNTGASL